MDTYPPHQGGSTCTKTPPAAVKAVLQAKAAADQEAKV